MERKVIIPGEFIGKNVKVQGLFYRINNSYYSSIYGLLEENQNYKKIIPLAGKYIPKPGDLIIGYVKDIEFSNWIFDINSPYIGILPVEEFLRPIDLPKEDLRKLLPLGTVAYILVKEFGRERKAVLSLKDKRVKILKKGRLIEIPPVKVPRIIGRKSSMIKMLKEKLKISIIVAQNGRIWLNGNVDDVLYAEKIIEYIVKNAHTSGLTDRVKEIIEKREIPK